MKWKGTVSQRPQTTIATRLTRAKPTHPASTQGKPWRGQFRRSADRDAMTLSPQHLDRALSKLGAQPPDVDVNHVGAGIEAISPDPFQQQLVAQRLTATSHQLPKQQELPLRQRHRAGARVGAPGHQVERQRAPAKSDALRAGPQPGLDPGQQLLEGERLGDVVLGNSPRPSERTLLAVSPRAERTITC